MTKEELIEKLNGSSIHATSEELASKVVKALYSAGMGWGNLSYASSDTTHWGVYKTSTAYSISEENRIQFGFWSEINSKKKISAESFLSWFEEEDPSIEVCQGCEKWKECSQRIGECAVQNSEVDTKQSLPTLREEIQEEIRTIKADILSSERSLKENNNKLIFHDSEGTLLACVDASGDYQYYNRPHSPEAAMLTSDWIKKMETRTDFN